MDIWTEAVVAHPGENEENDDKSPLG